MITEEQRKARSLGIGGSDMAIILGLSNYMTPYQLYLEKTGQGTIREETEQQYWGNQLEGIIREEFEKRNSVTVETPDTLIHPFYNHLRGNVDGFIPSWNAILEIKCSSSFMAHEWGPDDSDVIPMQYLVQVAHYCAITNSDCAYIAVLIGGNSYRQFKYERDLELEMKLITEANKFWDCVANKTPPEASTLLDLKLMFPQHVEKKKITVSGEIIADLETLVNNRLQIKQLDQIEEACKFNIMQFMQDSEVMTDATGKDVISWKTNKRGSRTFLIKGI